MPPAKQPATPSGGGSQPRPYQYEMPEPPPIVVWRSAPGGDTAYAVVTRRNKTSVSLMLFPPDSKIGIPKEAVRHASDPWNAIHGVAADSGVWDFTEESLLLRRLASTPV